MRILFAGTPEFARRALLALIEAGHEIVLVLTQPDRKAGRGMMPAGSPVKTLALERDLEIFQPPKLSDPAAIEIIRAASPQMMVVAAYGLILPQAVLDIAPLGAVNIHASLLPRWRGAAPIQRALLAGDRITGISIMQMERGLDTGPLIATHVVDITSVETAQTLHEKLAGLGAQMIVDSVRQAESTGKLATTPQATEGVTYAHKVEKREAWIDWRKPSDELDRIVRAFNPAPGAHATYQSEEIKFWRAQPVAVTGDPGVVQSASSEGLVVACGKGGLAVTELQRAGGKRLGIAQFLSGHPIAAGSRFTLTAA
jgi:methionyl-tRNA formyltransferase